MYPLKYFKISITVFLLLTPLFITVQAANSGTRNFKAPEGSLIYQSPEGVIESGWMKDRRAAQLATKGEFGAFVDFEFKDGYTASGITWINRVVDDAGYSYKAVHYDHGNGVAVADADGDGKLDIYFVNQIGSNALYRNVGDEGQKRQGQKRSKVKKGSVQLFMIYAFPINIFSRL